MTLEDSTELRALGTNPTILHRGEHLGRTVGLEESRSTGSTIQAPSLEKTWKPSEFDLVKQAEQETRRRTHESSDTTQDTGNTQVES